MRKIIYKIGYIYIYIFIVSNPSMLLIFLLIGLEKLHEINTNYRLLRRNQLLNACVGKFRIRLIELISFKAELLIRSIMNSHWLNK